MKFAYLLQSETTFNARFHEYSEVQFETSLMKDHKKAAATVSALSGLGVEWLRPFTDRLLSDDEYREYSDRTSAQERRRIDASWGFTNLLATLSKGEEGGFKGITALAIGYSTASHIQHADFVGVSLPSDREARSVENRNYLHLSHLGRLISDVFSMLFLRLMAAYRFLGIDEAPIKDAMAALDDLLSPMLEAQCKWAEIEYGVTDAPSGHWCA
ncbi:hypothetical protein [Luteibacter rhizovicinus]|uniref:hypothetical protein n=1 Tax=Luteibacter rhizovicinus TaxID=242606 RepID=UPI00104D598D|nr:hypothetical protein [Luteibacter rhizovicinus]